MNYNHIFNKKCEEILQNKILPRSVLDFFIINKPFKNLEILTLKDINKELKCFKNVLDNIDWREDFLLKISQGDLFLLNGYEPVTFKNELINPKKSTFSPDKIKTFLNLKDKDLVNLTPPIIIRKKIHGIDIYDGYHRIITLLTRNESIEFKCTVGLIKN